MSSADTERCVRCFGDSVRVEIVGTQPQKVKALQLLQNWGAGTLRQRAEKFKLRVADLLRDLDTTE